MFPLTVKAFAKINLGLLITGKRHDGYHTLETIFAPISWYDTLEFTEAFSISMSCTNVDLPIDDNNLCVKAAKSLQQFAGIQKGIAIKLHKDVPFGAGLGGGSSDAAAVLRVLNALWEVNASQEELHSLAVKLGADVPYFLEMKGLAYARGIGDELDNLPFTLPYYVVTVFPEEHISTAWAYKNFYPRFGRELPDLKKLASELCLFGKKEGLPAFENDFEQAVFDHFPAVRLVKSTLLDSGCLFSSLSGSGSALFGLFERKDEAVAAMKCLPEAYRMSLTPPGFSMEQ